VSDALALLLALAAVVVPLAIAWALIARRTDNRRSAPRPKRRK
jgi:hypothetical protein